jgi:hypothetical protein
MTLPYPSIGLTTTLVNLTGFILDPESTSITTASHHQIWGATSPDNRRFRIKSFNLTHSDHCRSRLRAIAHTIIPFFRDVRAFTTFRSHPVPVRFFGWNIFTERDPPDFLMVTEEVPSTSLATAIPSLTGIEKLIVLYGIAHAASFFMTAGLIIKDLSPANILLDKDKRPRLISVQRRHKDGDESDPYYRYRSADEDGSYKSECYSLGVLAYEVLTGGIADPKSEDEMPKACQLFEEVIRELWSSGNEKTVRKLIETIEQRGGSEIEKYRNFLRVPAVKVSEDDKTFGDRYRNLSGRECAGKVEEVAAQILGVLHGDDRVTKLARMAFEMRGFLDPELFPDNVGFVRT